MGSLRQRKAYNKYSTLFDMLELALENFNNNFHGTNKKQVEDATLRLIDAFDNAKECIPADSITMAFIKDAHFHILDEVTLSLKEFRELEFL